MARKIRMLGVPVDRGAAVRLAAAMAQAGAGAPPRRDEAARGREAPQGAAPGRKGR